MRGDQTPRRVPGPLHPQPLWTLLPVQQQEGAGEVQLSARTPRPPSTLQTGVQRGHRVPGLPCMHQVCLSHSLALFYKLHTDTIFSNKCKDPCPGASCGPNSECRVTNHRAVCHCKLHYRGNPPNCRLETTTTRTTRRTTTTTKPHCDFTNIGYFNTDTNKDREITANEMIHMMLSHGRPEAYTRCYVTAKLKQLDRNKDGRVIYCEGQWVCPGRPLTGHCRL